MIYLEFHDLRAVFSRSRATSLPSHCPYDCSFFRLYLLSVPEWGALENYLVTWNYRVGLVNAPAVFQALVNDVLRDMLNIFVFVYLDNILIFSPSLQVHVQHVRRVLQRLLENHLFVKAEKCMFHAQSVTFLGSVVSAEGISMDPDKVRAVID